jgi:hypothetical protein
MATATLADPTQTRNTLLAKYATYHNEPGYALRTADRRVFFVDHDAQMTELSNGDIPFLTLLGDVNTAEQQNLADRLAGGFAAIACSRDRAPQVRR